MDGVEFELVCPCGYENFERIVVQRRPHPPVVTDFVACVGCRAVYWLRVGTLIRADSAWSRDAALGGPEPRPDTSEALKRDAADAAKDYRKPGRSGRR